VARICRSHSSTKRTRTDKAGVQFPDSEFFCRSFGLQDSGIGSRFECESVGGGQWEDFDFNFSFGGENVSATHGFNPCYPSTHSLGDRTGKLAIHSCLHVRYGFDALFGIAEEKGAIETLIRLCA